MPITATAPVTVPARTLDRWHVIGLVLRLDPKTGKLGATYVVARGDAAGPSPDPAHRLPARTIPDVAAAFPDAPSQQTIATIEAGILQLVQADLAARKVL